MSEKMYTRLLRLYPLGFCKEYGDEALQLIRDRLRDEKGLLKKARLWWDLVVDVLAGLPRAYQNCYTILEGPSLSPNAESIPSFKALDKEPLGSGSILVAGTLSMLAITAFGFVLSRPIPYQSPSDTNGRMSPIETVLQRLNQAVDPGSPLGGDLDDAKSASAEAASESNPNPSAITEESDSVARKQNRALPIRMQNLNGRPMDWTTAQRAFVALPQSIGASPGFEVSTTKPSEPDSHGKLSFDVASIRLSKPDTFVRPSFGLNDSDTWYPDADPHGRLSADFPLAVYIMFAYKLMLTPDQIHTMLANFPEWVTTDRYVIEARSQGDPTKDQMRLMMQSLLADRFGFRAHFETRQSLVFALVLDKPGTVGPKLCPHAEGPPCPAAGESLARGWTAEASKLANAPAFPPLCDALMVIPRPNQTRLMGARNTTMQRLANSLAGFSQLGRPMVDQTGLSGNFDFTLEWTPEQNDPALRGAEVQSDIQGTSFLEAVKEQIGMRLKSTRAPLDVLVVDHVERPSEN